MKDRLKLLLESLKIPASEFADKLGVQRSSISHLLSGRNNPGLEFLQKVLVSYPQVNPDWLLLGSGNMTRVTPGAIKQDGLSPSVMEAPVEDIKGKAIEKQEFIIAKSNEVDQSPIEKIILLYKDGTFKEYISRKD